MHFYRLKLIQFITVKYLLIHFINEITAIVFSLLSMKQTTL